MDRFFIVYHIAEAHRKAALENEKNQKNQKNEEKQKQLQLQPQQQKNTSKKNDEEKRFEHDFSEWVYKMVNF